jgi:mRNA interferase RelE/StbE
MSEWQVNIHPLVFEEDFKKISLEFQQEIIKAIRKKLVIDPQGYGEPLRGNYKNYWKLRVGDFRVIYRLDKNQLWVFVIKVGIRRDYEVYKGLVSRLRKV